ncbi:phage baseplate assembly protein V [Raoultella ornithinolytica]|uniref:phage baseplate assembly protein V n=1 Tax=Raoultella ornithinolytica TaxID=54291 RepID=UPI002DB99F60|nr:phage baseplate assembly protein V [Raoultella ornithinolytica]MEB7861092.1 phage baseplate assembly protein V [Raoultella ornithinolytica]MEB7983253.1 phage baseplate assembly protein V [Raoultella ornithinolytica]
MVTGNNTTWWIHWLNAHAGKKRSWNAPSVGGQVLVLCLRGELNTGVVLPGISLMIIPPSRPTRRTSHSLTMR